MDRQSSGPLTNIPVAGREYEEVGGTSSMDRFRLLRGGEGRKTLALLGLRLGIQGMDVVYSAEVRVKGRLHCWDCVWNPGVGYCLFRGIEIVNTFQVLNENYF